MKKFLRTHQNIKNNIILMLTSHTRLDWCSQVIRSCKKLNMRCPFLVSRCKYCTCTGNIKTWNCIKISIVFYFATKLLCVQFVSQNGHLQRTVLSIISEHRCSSGSDYIFIGSLPNWKLYFFSALCLSTSYTAIKLLAASKLSKWNSCIH
jgi:hypothetical protein